MPGRLRGWAIALKRNVLALWIAARDERTPLAAKLIAGLVAAYALSPIDLIPDFIPVLGLLDDLLLLPAGIWLAIKLIPDSLMKEFRSKADQSVDLPDAKGAAVAVVIIWIVLGIIAAAATFQ